MQVEFVDESQVEEAALIYAIIVSRYEGKWVFCRHRDRRSWELPAGHRESGEDIIDSAHRELYEETGALDYHLQPLCYAKITDGSITDFGLLCFAEIHVLGPLPGFEIVEIGFFEDIPSPLTYPASQPAMLKYVEEYLAGKH